MGLSGWKHVCLVPASIYRKSDVLINWHLEHPPRNSFCPKPVPRCHHPYIFNHVLYTWLFYPRLYWWGEGRTKVIKRWGRLSGNWGAHWLMGWFNFSSPWKFWSLVPTYPLCWNWSPGILSTAVVRGQVGNLMNEEGPGGNQTEWWGLQKRESVSQQKRLLLRNRQMLQHGALPAWGCQIFPLISRESGNLEI